MTDNALYLEPQNGFNRLADTYDARMAGNPALIGESAATLTALPPLAGRTVLDAGCGTGRYALQMARMGADAVVGVDFAPEMLAFARRKAKHGELDNTEWREADLRETLPFPGAAFDAAVCALTLTFLPELPAVFAEFARVLSPDGALVISEMHPHGLCAARADSLTAGRRDNAPFLPFVSAEGEECRIAQTPHLVSDYINAAQRAGLTLEQITEPVADRRLATAYPGLLNRVGLPLAVVMRFVKV